MIMEDDGWIGGEGVTGWEYVCMHGHLFSFFLTRIIF